MTMDAIVDQVESCIGQASGQYHRLVLLAGPTGSGKTNVLRQVAESHAVSVVNVNLELSSRLLDMTDKQRALRLSRVLTELLPADQSLVVLDNLEILFDLSLQQDPLRLLHGLSRNQTVVASWNGTADGRCLIYAEPDHPEFRRYDNVDALIVVTDAASAPSHI